MKKFYSLSIPIPPKSLQDKFSKIVEKIESVKLRYQESLSELENLYGSLSQRAFKGELDLSRIPAPQKEIIETGEISIVDKETSQKVDEGLEYSEGDGWKLLATAALAVGGAMLGKKIYKALSSKKAKEIEYIKIDNIFLEKYFSSKEIISVLKKVKGKFLFEQLWEEIKNRFIDSIPDNKTPEDGWENHLYDHVKLMIFKLLENEDIIQSFDNDEKIMVLSLNK